MPTTTSGALGDGNSSGAVMGSAVEPPQQQEYIASELELLGRFDEVAVQIRSLHREYYREHDKSKRLPEEQRRTIQECYFDLMLNLHNICHLIEGKEGVERNEEVATMSAPTPAQIQTQIREGSSPRQSIAGLAVMNSRNNSEYRRPSLLSSSPVSPDPVARGPNAIAVNARRASLPKTSISGPLSPGSGSSVLAEWLSSTGRQSGSTESSGARPSTTGSSVSTWESSAGGTTDRWTSHTEYSTSSPTGSLSGQGGIVQSPSSPQGPVSPVQQQQSQPPPSQIVPLSLPQNLLIRNQLLRKVSSRDVLPATPEEDEDHNGYSYY
ncbi:hypothetical protein PYCC9005_002262 [Savitreella phatthalungensis]